MLDFQPFIQELNQTVQGDVLSDAYSLGMYATDASVYQIIPIVVVLPRDEEDVKKAVQLAGKYQIDILPRGGGTSLAGQTVGHSMVLDFSKYMNKTLELNVEERWVRVQPGKVCDELNAELAAYGLHFAPDPATASRANVGGMVGNNSSGTKSILYGKTVDHVLEAKVLLSDSTTLHLREIDSETYDSISRKEDREGAIYRRFRELIFSNAEEIKARFPKVMRRVGGYNLDEFVDTEQWNLSKLVCGSEGTLALTLELKLNLTPLPKHKSVTVVHYSSIPEAIRSVEPILAFQPAAVEILDATVVRLSRENLGTQRHSHFLEGDPAAVLIVEFYGDSPEDVLERPQQMQAHLKAQGFGYAYPTFPEGPEYRDVWIIRKKGLGLMLGIKGKKKPLAFIEDAGIPTRYLPEYIDRVLALCKANGTEAAMYAHASVGVIHVRPILDLRDPVDIERFKSIADGTFELVKEYGGSWSGEHGDGLVRSPYNRQFFGDQLYETFQEIKRLFDPEYRMNPGKIVDAPDIRENLRYGAAYRDEPVPSHYHYRTEQGFAEAVHMCTGVGECRKRSGGTMCPSFRATLDEEHSTRGRANALRLAMSNQLNGGGLAGSRLKEVMDLCLSCKACKSECPSNVDMARLKSDMMQIYYDAHGVPLRERLVGRAAQEAARWSGPMAGLVNRIQRSAVFRSMLERTARIDQRRILPAYVKKPFFQWFEAQTGLLQSDRKVVLFADTYLNYHEPQIGIAAVELLNACGYEVLLANVGCCQRPRISKGLLKTAKKEGQVTLMGLQPFLDQGLPILVCEPSCASALKDDWPDLLEEENLGKQLNRQIHTIAGFLDQEKQAGRLQLSFKLKTEGACQLHGHCHEKALFGTQAMHRLLGQEQPKLDEIPSGCCGMAGSFGYEKEHYEISRKIGEETLFPAVRAAGEGTEIIANGFSCRHQIEHFTGRTARHWVELIEVIPNETTGTS